MATKKTPKNATKEKPVECVLCGVTFKTTEEYTQHDCPKKPKPTAAPKATPKSKYKEMKCAACGVTFLAAPTYTSKNCTLCDDTGVTAAPTAAKKKSTKAPKKTAAETAAEIEKNQKEVADYQQRHRLRSGDVNVVHKGKGIDPFSVQGYQFQ